MPGSYVHTIGRIEARFPRLSVEKEFAQAPLLVGGQKIGDDTSMNEFVLFAEPWWVKLLIAILFVAYFLWARDPMADACYLWPLRHRLRVRGGFGGRLPSRRGGTLAGIRRNARRYRTPFVRRLPASEDSRRTSPEFAHGRALPGSRDHDHASLHCPSRGRGCTGRWAMFLWTFAVWDVVYHVGLWATVRWPSSLTTPDVLFLIPVPWLSQVWFPLLVSALALGAVLLARRGPARSA